MTDKVYQTMKNRKVCVVVPTYNNATTVADVVRRTAAVAPDVVVVVDGSTDDTRQRLARLTDVSFHTIDYPDNRGKGHALLAGFKYAISHGFEYAVTIDSDGQHYPEDIPLLVAAMEQSPEALIVGSRNLTEENMPGGNTFANKFSNFWFALYTGRRLPDTQTGFRLYPLRLLSGVWAVTPRYEAELELMVYMAWSGVRLEAVPVRVYYPPAGERVSHFRPVADFLRITLLNCVLAVVSAVYGWPRMLLSRVRRLLRPHKSPAGGAARRLAVVAATAWGATAAGADRLTEYLPATPATTAVIVCPGGSYFWLDRQTEGDSVARSLCQAGIAAYVLSYRTGGVLPFVTRSRLVVPGHHHPMPLRDVEDALRRVRQTGLYRHVGVMGFSAGGHLALSSAILSPDSLRPDFVAPCYPVVTMSHAAVHRRSRRGLLGEWKKSSARLRDSLSLERHVTPLMPPVFLMNCVDDPVVDYRNSVLMDSALTASGVPHRYVQYRTGGHGFGTTWSKTTAEASHWFDEFLSWLGTLFNTHNPPSTNHQE